MVRFVSLAVLTLALYAATASAQYVIVHSPPPAYPVVTYSAPAPVYYSAPAVSYSAPSYSAPVYTPAVSYSYYAPPASYSYAPATSSSYSYYAPPASYSYYAPAASYSYYAPTTTVYSAPAVYSPVPGAVTTRSYVGLGIFRPRGVYTQSYYTPLP